MHAREMGVPIMEIRDRLIGAAVAAVLQPEIVRMRADGARVLACERYARPYYVQGRGTSALQSPALLRVETVGQAWTQAEHDAAARAWLETAKRLGDAWNGAVTDARAQYGDHGPLVSGVYRDHFPADVKDQLRALAHARTFAIDASIAHWIGGARRRIETWRRVKEATGI